MDSFEAALKAFDATEANLRKLERLWESMQKDIPDGISFSIDNEQEYDDKCRDFGDILKALPAIDGWEIPHRLCAISDIARMRFDAEELGDIEAKVHVEIEIFEQEKLLQEYGHRLRKKRRELVRDRILGIIDAVDSIMRLLSSNHPDPHSEPNDAMTEPEWEELQEKLSQLDTLMGSDMKRPSRWTDLIRHAHFGQLGDYIDIKTMDWPNAKRHITSLLYGETDPIPVETKDLGELVAAKPKGEIPTKLNWESLSPSDFERLIFAMISEADGYENPEWLMRTNAPDKGRDLSVIRVFGDPLSGVRRSRVIIQCKHWLTKSISMQDVATTKEQVKLWEPPRVDILTIATSGRFTSDAVSYVEKHNQADSAITIDMWPESHLERLLASRPGLVAEFHMR